MVSSELSSACSSIDIWLDSQPTVPENYEPLTPSTSPLYTCKRPAHVCTSNQQPPPSKRVRLAEIAANNVDMAGNRRSARTPSPRKRLQDVHVQAPTTQAHVQDQGGSHDHSSDQDQTPTRPTRPTPKLGRHPPPLSSDTSSIDNGSVTSSKNKRSRSPVKQLADLRLADIRVELELFETNERPLHPTTKRLYLDMRDVGKGRRVIPKAFETRMKAAPTEDTDELNFAKGDGIEDVYLHAESFEIEYFWRSTLQIQKAALQCEKEKLPESAWNGEVHMAILKLALSHYWESKGVWYRDITKAQVTDPSLLPTVTAGVTQSKMADFALIIHPRAGVEEDVVHKCQAAGTASINQTSVEYLRFAPIAVSIETKRGAVNEDEAHIQLALWVFAHFAKLKQLANCNSVMPVLPLVKILGHDWYLMLAERLPDQRIVILKEVHLGRTRTALGIFQVVASIRRLARWVHEEYQPWFATNVLSLDQ